MSLDTLAFTGQLTVVTCWCGTTHAVPKELREYQLRKFHAGEAPHAIYCPLGHTYFPSGTPEHKRLEAELQRERARHDQTRSEVRTQFEVRKKTERQLSATKGVLTRTKNRIANGTCPCCNRHFKDLAQHIHQEHRDYVESDE